LETQAPRKPWYRRGRYIVLVIFVVALLVVYLLAFVFTPPPSPTQVRLNMAIDYFANNYNETTGLIPETPGSQTFWLYSDNYLAALAISRYDPSNQSTSGFATSLNVAFEGYLSTLPGSLARSQYTALNSTSAYFDCSTNYSIGWTSKGQLAPSGSAVIMTTSNSGSPSCASQNYADLLFLQALYYHRIGNSNESSTYFSLGAADFDGKGLVDSAFNGTLYQTYKLALYLYASSCLGHASGSSFSAANNTLWAMQDTSTGGFYTGYNSAFSPSGTTVNTETTALAALAIEQLIRPSSSC